VVPVYDLFFQQALDLCFMLEQVLLFIMLYFLLQGGKFRCYGIVVLFLAGNGFKILQGIFAPGFVAVVLPVQEAHKVCKFRFAQGEIAGVGYLWMGVIVTGGVIKDVLLAQQGNGYLAEIYRLYRNIRLYAAAISYLTAAQGGE